MPQSNSDGPKQGGDLRRRGGTAIGAKTMEVTPIISAVESYYEGTGEPWTSLTWLGWLHVALINPNLIVGDDGVIYLITRKGVRHA